MQEAWQSEELELGTVSTLRYRIQAARIGWPGFTPSEALILECLYHNFMTRQQLRVSTQIKNSTLTTSLKRLVHAEFVVNPEMGIYRLAEGTEKYRTLGRRNERKRRRKG